jgi:hypothetical protein
MSCSKVIAKGFSQLIHVIFQLDYEMLFVRSIVGVPLSIHRYFIDVLSITIQT